MKSDTITPRKGWRFLRKGEIIRRGDVYYLPAAGRWRTQRECASSLFNFVGSSVGENAGDLDSQPWIRKKRAVKKKGARK